MKIRKTTPHMYTALSGVVYIQAISFVFTMFMLIFACRNQEESNMPTLNPVESYKIDIPETSDLCFGSTKDILYTVSDNTGKAYKISTKGSILSELQYAGSDLEGICFVDNQFIYVAEERLRKIIKLNLQGSMIEQRTVSVENNAENEGLEGITYATFNQHFYIVNEMNPKVLIETDKNLNVLNEYLLKFADDYSGICVDNTNQELWIVSDLSSTVTKCTMTGESIKSYRIPVFNAEGIAYHANDSLLYIVSDSQSKLYKFKISN